MQFSTPVPAGGRGVLVLPPSLGADSAEAAAAATEFRGNDGGDVRVCASGDVAALPAAGADGVRILVHSAEGRSDVL